HAVLVGDPLAQRDVADRRPVAGDAGGVVVEGADGGGLQALDVDDVEGRGAPGEGDGVRHTPTLRHLERRRAPGGATGRPGTRRGPTRPARRCGHRAPASPPTAWSTWWSWWRSSSWPSSASSARRCR